MELHQRVCGAHCGARFDHDYGPDAKIDDVLNAVPACAQDHRGAADQFGIEVA